MKKLTILTVLVLSFGMPFAAALTVRGGDAVRRGAVASSGPTAIIVLENKPRTKIVGNPNAPYLNSLRTQGVDYTNYREASSTGPSLPDYLQLTAGSSCGRTSDTVKFADPGISSACPTTLWSQLESAGRTWTLYMDVMPSACYKGSTFKAGNDQYALKHDPGPLYAQLPNCAQHVKPFLDLNVTAMPDVSFISPSICNDMHGSKATWAPSSCFPGSAALIKRGDNWVKALVPGLLANGVEVFVTFDESGVLYAVKVAPGVTVHARPRDVDTRALNHYDWLAYVEDRYGLPRLRGAIGRPGL